MVEIDVDITPETDDDDSYSSSFHETDSDIVMTKMILDLAHTIWQMKLKVDSQEYKLRMLTQLLRNYSPFLILVYFLRKACFIFC